MCNGLRSVERLGAPYRQTATTIYVEARDERLPVFRRVPAVYLGWANPVFVAFFSLSGINNLGLFIARFPSIPTRASNEHQSNCEFYCLPPRNKGFAFSNIFPLPLRRFDMEHPLRVAVVDLLFVRIRDRRGIHKGHRGRRRLVRIVDRPQNIVRAEGLD